MSTREMVTMKALSARILGLNVTWPNMLALASEADRVMVCFQTKRGGIDIAQAMEVPKAALIKRATWAASRIECAAELVSVFACGGLLYFGGKS